MIYEALDRDRSDLDVMSALLTDWALPRDGRGLRDSSDSRTALSSNTDPVTLAGRSVRGLILVRSSAGLGHG